MRVSTVISLISVLGIGLVNGDCPSGWRQYAGSCYFFQLEIMNWVAARSMCIWHNSDLIAIETPEEQAWFKEQVLKYNQTEGDDGFWLGATNWEDESQWVWESAKKVPATYIVWGILPVGNNPRYQQPNNRNGTEDCMAATKFFEYNWSDAWCNWDRLGYVCEMPESSAPLVG